MRISSTQRIQNENRIRAAMDRLLRGEIPPGGNCDIKTLASQAGVDRTAFYGNRPYAHLRTEFEDRAAAAAELRLDTRPESGADPTTQGRGWQAPNPSRPSNNNDRRTHRLPNQGTRETRRPARRDPAAPHRRRPERQRHSTTSPAEGHRPMLTRTRQSDIRHRRAGLSPHTRQAASRIPHPDPPSSNATRTQPHTVTAERRRTLSLEMAYRPGGVLASKIHMKHCVVATTEGYASRPGGAQGELLAEVNNHEADRNLELVLAEFRNYQNGILPAGPGARSLTEFFASIDTDLNTESVAAPKLQRNDRDILNLLSKRAKALQLGPANYCWFADPSRALCLKLAGTPTATRPLIGMCDSARCPQATHHQVHRPVWAEHAERTKTFLGQLGKTRATERERLTSDYTRALRVIADIDAATTPTINPDRS
jgi:hypothetical protein